MALLTVETEANGDSKSTNEMGPTLVASLGSSCRPALAALVSPVQMFFPRRTLFQFICPHRPAIWAGNLTGSPFS